MLIIVMKGQYFRENPLGSTQRPSNKSKKGQGSKEAKVDITEKMKILAEFQVKLTLISQLLN